LRAKRHGTRQLRDERARHGAAWHATAQHKKSILCHKPGAGHERVDEPALGAERGDGGVDVGGRDAAREAVVRVELHNERLARADGRAHGARDAPGFAAINAAVGLGCAVAIQVAKRV
jgi:hypothetical protein